MTRLLTESLKELEGLARSQLGLFTTGTAREAGVSPHQLRHHSQRGGRWIRVHPRVYRLRDLPQDWRRPHLAALLWAGGTGVLSHRAAARILGLDGIPTAAPELWLPSRTRAPEGILPHNGTVAPEDVTTTGRLRHTTLLRTLQDLAPLLGADTADLVGQSALRRDRKLEPILRATTHLLDRHPPGEPPTESELETRYLQVLRLAPGLPPPRRQLPILDGLARLDFCWPDAGLWVELDGRATHELPTALLADRHRQNLVTQRLEWLPLRFTYGDVVDHPLATARATEAAYRRRVAERTA